MGELLIEIFKKPTEIWPDGTMVWRNEYGEFHRDNDLPAIIYLNGDKYWYKNGKRHRYGDNPAVICADGGKSWYKNGKFIKRISA